MIRHRSTEFMTFSMSLAAFVVSLLWTIYGHLIQDKFILVSCENSSNNTSNHNRDFLKNECQTLQKRWGFKSGRNYKRQ